MDQDLLTQMFDQSPHEIIMVSSYDRTVTYMNPRAEQANQVQRLHSSIGSDVDDVLQQHGLRVDNTPIGRCLADPGHGQQVQARPRGGWWAVTCVPSMDARAPEIFGSAHSSESRDLAMAEHDALVVRVALALEFDRARRMQAAGLAAINDASRRMDWIGTMLATNPVVEASTDESAPSPQVR